MVLAVDVSDVDFSSQITLINWTEYLCDFLETINIPDSSTYLTAIKRGHYGLLDARAKLGILRELINQVVGTDLVREKLDECIEQRQVLGATRREEALEEGRKKREEKERLKADSVANGVMNGHNVESMGNDLHSSTNENHSSQNGEIAKKRKGEIISSQQIHAFSKRFQFFHMHVYAKS